MALDPSTSSSLEQLVLKGLAMSNAAWLSFQSVVLVNISSFAAMLMLMSVTAGL